MASIKAKRLFLAALLCALAAPAALCQALAGLEAGRAENIGPYRPNPQGVYPVRLRWRQPTQGGPQAYHVYRSSSRDSGFERVSAGEGVRLSGDFATFVDENSAAVPGRPYYYRVMQVNSAGAAVPFSETAMGYGALSPEAYLREYSKTLVSSHSKLTLMHKPGAMAKLGSEQKPGSAGGTLSYNARVVGLGGRVIMEYSNYADFYIDGNRSLGPYFTLNGNMNTTAAMNLSGTMDGTVTVSGMYPGKVYYDKVLIKDATAGGGTFGIEPAGFPRTELSWTLGEQR